MEKREFVQRILIEKLGDIGKMHLDGAIPIFVEEAIEIYDAIEKKLDDTLTS